MNYRLNNRQSRDWTFKPLSAKQRSIIGRMATQAYEAEVAAGRVFPTRMLSKSASAQEWRHQQYAEETGHEELADCNQSHYRGLVARFEAMIPRADHSGPARAFNRRMKSGPANDSAEVEDTHEARELWHDLLNKALTQFNLHEAYVAAICRRQFSRELREASAQQLQWLTFTVRKRGVSKRRKAAAGVSRAYHPDEDCPF
jgi:hypothetical protein